MTDEFVHRVRKDFEEAVANGREQKPIDTSSMTGAERIELLEFVRALTYGYAGNPDLRPKFQPIYRVKDMVGEDC